MLTPICQYNPLVENINVIRALEIGQSLDVIEDGSLKIISQEKKRSIDKLHSSLGKAHHARVQKAIGVAINALPIVLKDPKEIKHVIKKLALLDKAYFDRSTISKEVEDLLCPNLNPILDNKNAKKSDLRTLEVELLKRKKEFAEWYCRIDSRRSFSSLLSLSDEELLWYSSNTHVLQKNDKKLEDLYQAYDHCVSKRHRCRNEYEELRAEFKIESVRLANKLGIDFKPLNSGFSGSYMGLDRFSKPCLIFKPKDEEALTGNSPATTVRFLIALKEIVVENFGLKDPNACLTAGQGYLAEVGASAVSRFLGLEAVPNTSVQKFKSKTFSYSKGQPFIKKEGSCQMFKREAQTAKKALEMPDGVYKGVVFPVWRRIKKQFINAQIPVHEFQKVVLLMWINGELDGHEDNWLIKIKKNGSHKLVKIDSGMSFYKQHPNSPLQGIYQHAWKWLPQAKISFGCYCRALLNKIESEEKVEALLSEVERSMTVEGYSYFTHQQKVVMRERITVLKHFVTKGKTPRKIVEIRTQQDFEKWFDKRNRKMQPKEKALTK